MPINPLSVAVQREKKPGKPEDRWDDTAKLDLGMTNRKGGSMNAARIHPQPRFETMRILLAFFLFAVSRAIGAGDAATQENVTPKKAIPSLRLMTENAPPFNYPGKDGQTTGLSVDIVREILRRLGTPDHPIELLPWNRAYRIVETEPNTALFSMTRTPEREPLFHWVGPLADNTWCFYARKDRKLVLSSFEDAKPYRIGTYLNDACEIYLKELGFPHLDSVNDDLTNVRKLAAGRIDLWIVGKAQMPCLAQQAGIDPARFESVLTVKETLLYLAFNRKTSPEIIEEWQRIFAAMESDGTLASIRKKYLGSAESVPKGTAE